MDWSIGFKGERRKEKGEIPCGVKSSTCSSLFLLSQNDSSPKGKRMFFMRRMVRSTFSFLISPLSFLKVILIRKEKGWFLCEGWCAALSPFLFLLSPFQRPYLQLQVGLICWKKSLPLLSTRMNAGKSSTSIFQIASMPSSGYSTHSMLLMLFCARIAAGPPIEPR